MNCGKIYHVAAATNPEKATWLTDFVFPWLDRAAPETRFRAWHHSDIFHFEFQVEDHDLVINQSENNHEKVLGSDRVEIFISQTPDLSLPYYGFEIDPRGLIYDYKGVFHRNFDPAWTLESITTQAEITPNGYRVVGTIPMNDLRDLNCLKGAKMITGVYRGEFSHLPGGRVHQEWISWVAPGTKIPDFHVPESFGLFVFEDVR